MDLKHLSICIKDSSFEQAKSALLDLGIYNYVDEIGRMFNINIAIEDYREMYADTNKFLTENNLKDDNPFFNHFKIESYGLQIDFEVLPSFQYLHIVEPLVFILGEKISLILNTECLVMFESMRIPIGLFVNGILTDSFQSYNEQFFNRRVWHPQKSKT